MIFFDSSAILPAFFSGHVHYQPTLRTYNGATHPRCCCCHSLAEIYNTATRPSAGIGASPGQAGEILSKVRRDFQLITLEPEDYQNATEGLIRQALRGPIIYDALLLQCARKVNAETIYTWNVRHFQRLAPDLAERIRTP